ncbi:cuticle protein 16.5 [Eurytemora carolleeae]|uniref:cuticle protein 16.5 n=1 Tax=Eurytemora carolleeae TaxID=1294199 RepID=UPI000C78F3CD|nr:cuticle protein 16.5 [Eurytemora carolleeae]|eukprot:XP_023330580.1 cuticle protein 16.5-like [Eurytemora affinis]
MWSRIAVLVAVTASCHAGLLGAGFGEGSCAAAPFRSAAVKWPLGCPAHASCCTEYGYCRGEDEWRVGAFRDCNGVSNGLPLAPEAIEAEAAAAAAGDNSAANLIVVPAGADTAGLATVGYAAAAPTAALSYAPAVASYAPASVALPLTASYQPSAGYAASPAYQAAAPASYAAIPAAYAAAPYAYATVPATYAAVPAAYPASSTHTLPGLHSSVVAAHGSTQYNAAHHY